VKTRLLIEFPQQLATEPVTYNLVKKYNLIPNILKAHIDIDMQGLLLIEIEGTKEDIDNGILYMRGLRIKVTPINAAISIDMERCLHCGACVAACEANAITRNVDNKIHFDPKLCRECMLCIKACPLRAIKSIF
jgi:ferredoxin